MPERRRAPAPSRRALLDRSSVTGAFVKLSAAPIVDMVAASFDFAVVDREHSQLSEGEALALLERARLNGLPALLRLPSVDPAQVNRALEAGAVGIQLSMVRSVAQVRALRRASLYPPAGERSVSLAHPAGDYGRRALGEYGREQAAQRPILVAQIETLQTDDPLEEILAAGVDVAFIGGLDLAHATGSDRSRLAARVGEIATAAERAGVRLGGAGVSDPRIVFAVDHTDVGLFQAGVTGAVGAAALDAASSTDDGDHPPARAGLAEDRRALEDLLVEFSYRLDVGGGRGVAELFVPDGTYTLDGRTLHGRDEIRAGYESRASRGGRTARHLVSNVRITMLSADRARIESCLVLYAADGEPVHVSEPPLVIGDFVDVAVRHTEGGWLLESRELQTLFRGSAPVVSPAGVS